MMKGDANRHEGGSGKRGRRGRSTRAVDEGGRGDAPRQDHAAVELSEQFGKIQQAICHAVIGSGDEPEQCTGIPVTHRSGADPAGDSSALSNLMRDGAAPRARSRTDSRHSRNHARAGRFRVAPAACTAPRDARRRPAAGPGRPEPRIESAIRLGHQSNRPTEGRRRQCRHGCFRFRRRSQAPRPSRRQLQVAVRLPTDGMRPAARLRA